MFCVCASYTGVMKASDTDEMGRARKILRETFGFDSFRGAQEEIVAQVIAGGDALVLMPTGGGKSLCYQLPAIVRRGTGVVVSPLIALMQDQVEALRQLGVRAAFLNSSLDVEEARLVFGQLMRGELDLLYVSPERLLMPDFLATLSEVERRAGLALFAIDEAHCVSQWGHDFRPEYRKLTILHEKFPLVPRVALTATADAPTRNEIIERLTLSKARQFVSSFDRPNIRYRVSQKDNAKQQLLGFLQAEHPDDAGIVYCLSRKKVDETAAWLKDRGRHALPYHAGMTTVARSTNQRRFLREEGVVIVATVAFGMGIDKPNVRFVAHLDLPKSMEGYYQETGRAGRDGLPADAWMVYGLGDVVSMRAMIAGGDAPEERKRVEIEKLNALLGFCESTECRHQTILRYFVEQHPGACAECDNCLEPVTTWNATREAQMALSCVYRTGQRFGASHLTDILLGKITPRIETLRHHELPTFGVGQSLSRTQWSSVYRQLIAAGLLAVDVEGHGGLSLAESAHPVLRGTRELCLRRDVAEHKDESEERDAPTARTRGRSSRSSRSSAKAFARATGSSHENDPLWIALKSKRTELAREQGVPPYVIFHDSTLLDILASRPKTLADFETISGVGKTKLARYGHIFIDVVASV